MAKVDKLIVDGEDVTDKVEFINYVEIGRKKNFIVYYSVEKLDIQKVAEESFNKTIHSGECADDACKIK